MTEPKIALDNAIKAYEEYVRKAKGDVQDAIRRVKETDTGNPRTDKDKNNPNS